MARCTRPELRALARDLLALTKPRVTLMVVSTALGGACASPQAPQLAACCAMLLSVALLVGSANTLNCYLERESDKHMPRTRQRPLPAGRLSPALALGWGLGLAALALPALLLASNGLTAALGALSLVSYVCVYTPLKRRSPWALHVGAVPGALPPLLGFTASCGQLGATGLALFALLLVWQLPHFLAIAIFRKAEYAQAGLRSLPVVAGDAVARRHMFLSLAALLPVGALPFWLGAAGVGYALSATLAAAAWLGYALLTQRRLALAVWARRNFVASLGYLLLVVAALVLDIQR